MFTFRTHANLFAPVMIAALLASALAGVAPVLGQSASALGTTWYVAPSGNDLNACTAPGTSCATINGAVAKAASTGDTIKVAVGTYTASSGTEVVLIDKGLTLSGGWDGTFSTQSDVSVIDGQGMRRGVTSSASLTLDHFKIQNGWAERGGGIYSAGALVLNNSIVTHNSSIIPQNAVWGEGGGGGIWAGDVLTIDHSVISENTRGGGIWGGFTTINSSVLDHNSPTAIASWVSNLSVNNSTVSNNVGGGIWSSQGTINVRNSTISGTLDGWAISSGGTFVYVYSTTIANNAGGAYFNGGSASFTNSILADNSPDGGLSSSDCSGWMGSGGYNLVGNGSTCAFGATTGDQIGTADAPIDAKLGPLTNNGGPTPTHALLQGSPAIDAGNPRIPVGGENACEARDQRGRSRGTAAAGGCDIGAYESVPLGVSSIRRAGVNPTSAGAESFTVEFDVPVNGVDAADFALTTTGSIAGASVTGVEGSGSQYTVAVNTGSDIGALRLDVVDDDGIMDAYGSEPLGGAGIGNGNFTSGEEYAIVNPQVLSVVRRNANPTAAAIVSLTVRFSSPVVGVDKTDFHLTTNGLVGAKVTAVTPVGGPAMAYIVTVNHGTGSGTLRLDVVDDDSITGPFGGRPLGGPGAGTGNFTMGQAYVFVPIPQAPSGIVWDTTPTFKWLKLSGATQYRLQVYKGTTPTYSIVVPATVGNTSLGWTTPATILSPGLYKWRVQAFTGGAWRGYSTYKSFTVKGATPGLWGTTGLSFYVMPDRSKVKNFTVTFTVQNCPYMYKVTAAPIPIVNGEFYNYTSDWKFLVQGTFQGTKLSPTVVSGGFQFRRFPLPGCGTLTTPAPVLYTAYWMNSSQPLEASLENAEPLIITLPPGTSNSMIKLEWLMP